MNVERFEMERWQSQWENVVEYNLAESGVEPMSASDLAADDELRSFGKRDSATTRATAQWSFANLSVGFIPAPPSRTFSLLTAPARRIISAPGILSSQAMKW